MTPLMMTHDTADLLSRRLHELTARSPDLAWAARLYDAILPVLSGEEFPVPSVSVSEEEVRAVLKRDIPLLEEIGPDFDADRVFNLLIKLGDAAEKSGANVSAEKIRRWLDETYAGDRSAALQAILEGHDEKTGDSLKRMGMDDVLYRFLAQTAMMPLLRSWRRQLAPIAAEVRWDRDICYVCGSFPLFAELQGNDQEKHLRCGLCGADWRVRRLSCSHCGNEDHRSLKTLFPEQGHDGPRIEACDRCMTYLKVIPAFSPTPAELLPVEDLATHYLDAAAVRNSYRRAADAA